MKRKNEYLIDENNTLIMELRDNHIANSCFTRCSPACNTFIQHHFSVTKIAKRNPINSKQHDRNTAVEQNAPIMKGTLSGLRSELPSDIGVERLSPLFFSTTALPDFMM